MYSGLKYILIFSIGAAIGAAVTWKTLITKYEQIAQEEIESMKEYYSKSSDAKPDSDISEDSIPEEEAIDIGDNKKPDLASYADIIKKEYYNYSDSNSHVNTEEVEDVKNPNIRIISPEEFGEEDGYRTLSFTYYADEVLTNEANEVVENVDDIVGSESLTHFGEYEDDSVFVRNDEILLDERKYTEVMDE